MSSSDQYILGISASYHDSPACLSRNGEIVAAAQEERFTRKKGSLANWHPPLPPAGNPRRFRPDGTFVRLPLPDVTTLTDAFRRAVLRLFVRGDDAWLPNG